MMMPAKVRVGSQWFDVIERSRHDDGMLNDGTFGYTLDTENLIVIDSDIAHSRQQLTLWHELMHAARNIYDTSVMPKKSDSFDTWEHYFIGVWEESLLVLIRDNPELLEYLLSDGK